MKTTNIKVIISAIAVSLAAVLVATRINSDSLPTVAAAISYGAVGILFILAAMDSRRSPRRHSTR